MEGRRGEVARASLLFCLVIGGRLVTLDIVKGGAPLPLSYLADFPPGWDARYQFWHPLLYDGVGQFLPWRKLAGEALRQGIFPLWNPFSFCGHPFLANGQSALLYPPTWLFALLPPLTAYTVEVFLHLFAAALGTFLWLRRRAGYTASVLGGLAYALSAPLVLKIPVLTHLCASSLLPWALLGVETALERGNLGSIVLGAASLALPVLAGHFQMASFVWLAVLVYGLALVVRAGRGRRATFALRLALSATLALVFAFPQLLPTAEFARVSHRAARPSLAGWEFFRRTALHPAMLLALLSSVAFLFPGQGWLGPSDFVEGLGSVSAVLLPLAALALIRRRKEAVFPAFLCLLSVLVAAATPVALPLYLLMPSSATPSRILFLWAFGLSALGAVGFDEAARAIPSRKEAGAAIAGVLGAFGLFYAVAVLLWPEGVSPLMAADLGLTVLGGLLLFLLRGQGGLGMWLPLLLWLPGVACQVVKRSWWEVYFEHDSVAFWESVAGISVMGLLALFLFGRKFLLALCFLPAFVGANVWFVGPKEWLFRWKATLLDLALASAYVPFMWAVLTLALSRGRARLAKGVLVLLLFWDFLVPALEGEKRDFEAASKAAMMVAELASPKGPGSSAPPPLRRRFVGTGRACGAIARWPLFGQPIASLPPNTTLLGGALDISGYDSLHLMSYRQLLGALQGRDPSPPENGNIASLVCPRQEDFEPRRAMKLLQALGGRVFVPPWPFERLEALEALGLEYLVLTKNGTAYLLRRTRPLAFVPSRLLRARDWREGARLLGSKGFEPLEEAVAVSRDLPSAGEGRTLEAFATWDGLWAEVEVEKPSPLVLLLPAAPGLKVWLDGRLASYCLADLALTCLPLPEGRHEVTAVYHSGSFSVALFVALLAALALSGVAAFGRMRRR